MSEPKQFHIRTILTATTGRLLTKSRGGDDNGIGDLYQLLGWLTSDEPFTHQLGRFMEECKPWLLRWFPELSQAETPEANLLLDGLIATGDIGIESWWRSFGFQEFYDVPKIPTDDHTKKHPYDELVEMRGTDDGIIVVKKE